MSEYCKCKGCKHIDPTERSGYKWYCTWYRSYEDPDEIRECSHYDNGDKGGCFLTSACCEYKGLPDDCAELTVLRNFRDTYLKSTEMGCELVSEYYRIAPEIVEKLNVHPEREKIYTDMYASICAIVDMIEKEEYDSAIEDYKKMVLSTKEFISKIG